VCCTVAVCGRTDIRNILTENFPTSRSHYQKFSNVSPLLNSLFKMTIELTSEKYCQRTSPPPVRTTTGLPYQVRGFILQCVAVCCSVWQCVEGCASPLVFPIRCVGLYCSELQCVAVCCSVLQCGEVCVLPLVFPIRLVGLYCSVLQCVAVC